MLIEKSLQGAKRDRAEQLADHPLAAEELERRYRSHLETRRETRILSNVHLCVRQAPGAPAGDFFQQRRDRPAWPTPRRPEINQHRKRGRPDFGVEAIIGSFDRRPREELAFATAAA